MQTLLAQQLGDWSLWDRPWTDFYIQGTLCAIIVGVTCGVLGCFVVLRRMALIGDALSHAVLPGVVLAFMFSRDAHPVTLLIGALASGVVASVLINVVTHHSRTKEDSSIGVVFTAMFALGILLTNMLPRGTHFDLQCFLFDDALAVQRADLVVMMVVGTLVLLTVGLLYHRLKLVSFDPLVAAAMGVSVGVVHYLLMGMLSATVVAGLKTTGVVLVVAMVITPASAAYQLTNRFAVMLGLGGLFGGLSAALGMSVAFVFNASTGPAMVIVATGFFALAMLLSPSHGIVFDALRRNRLARHVRGEDVLKTLLNHAHGSPSEQVGHVSRSLDITDRAAGRAIRRLTREGLVVEGPSTLTLSADGQLHATELVRAHRLWETYLADKAGGDLEDIHNDAERLEHAHELTEKLDDALGRPATDPHGSTIPRPQG